MAKPCCGMEELEKQEKPSVSELNDVKIKKAGFENVEMKEHFVYTKESLGALLNVIEGEEVNRMKKLLQANVPITSSKFVALKPI